jgi:hypothetical protein
MRIHIKDIVSLTHDGVNDCYELIYQKTQASPWTTTYTDNEHEVLSKERYEDIRKELADYEERVRSLQIDLWRIKREIDEQSYIEIGDKSC